MRVTTCLAVLLSLVLAACGGASSQGTPATTLPAPSQLAVAENGVDQLALTWDPPLGEFDGYELEGRTSSNAFQKLHSGLIPVGYSALLVTFTATAPDNQTYGFRLRAVQGTACSPYSNEAAYLRGPNAPGQASTAYDWTSGAVALNWDRNTSGSDGLLIERAECGPNGSLTGAWDPLPVPDPAISHYLDSAAPKGRFCTYRLTNLQGSRPGQPSAPSAPVFTGLIPLSWVTATYDPARGGVVVSWGSSPGARPDGVLLERSDCESGGASQGNWTALALPQGYQAAYLDQGVTLGARYTYRATTLYGSNATAPCLLPYSIPIPAPAAAPPDGSAPTAPTAAGVALRPLRLWLDRGQGRVALD